MRGPPPQHRLPLAPLMAAARVDTHGELGQIVRQPREMICRYAAHGVPMFAADRMACRIGMHPASVWPEWFDIDVPVSA